MKTISSRMKMLCTVSTTLSCNTKLYSISCRRNLCRLSAGSSSSRLLASAHFINRDSFPRFHWMYWTLFTPRSTKKRRMWRRLTSARRLSQSLKWLYKSSKTESVKRFSKPKMREICASQSSTCAASKTSRRLSTTGAFSLKILKKDSSQ